MEDRQRAAGVIEQAADLIRVNGHHQGDYWPKQRNTTGRLDYPGDVPCCILGSLHAVEGCELNTGAETYLEEHIRIASTSLGIAAWNDKPGRTAEETIEMMLTVAKDLRNGDA